MSRILYYLIMKPASLLPLPLLYVLSDFLYLLLYRLIGYRKKVVRTNLKNSFPDKSEAERLSIERKFYRHLFDLMVEAIRNFSIPKAELLRRCPVTNPEIFEYYKQLNKKIIIVAGHYNNWELAAIACGLQIIYPTMGIYSPFSDKFMNERAIASRGRFGMELVSKKLVKDYFERNKNRLSAVMFGADQSPSNAAKAYWTTFLNQDTAVMFGTEKYAVEYDYAVVYGHVQKLRRGYYQMTFIPLEDHPTTAPYGSISEKHTRMLEQHILEAPEYWLWTHKRWKRKREVNK
ncbi:MAG: lysophospholipid acyltransferase family protein [Saprospiraceae bacterium]